MKIITSIARTLLGLIFAVFGANIFLHFIPMPPPEGMAGDFLKVMLASHYLDVTAVFQVVGGLILLSGRFTPLGLTISRIHAVKPRWLCPATPRRTGVAPVSL